MSEWAILDDDNRPVSKPILEAARWLENNSERKIVGRDEVNGAKVSTVFLGLNHSFVSGVNKWFETMIFGGKYDQFQERYSTYEEAKAGHAEVVSNLKKGLSPEREARD